MFLQWNLNHIFCIYYRLLSLLNAMLSLEIAGQFPQPLSQRLHVQYDAVKDLENRMDKRHIPLKKQESEESDNESESDSDSENENESENESENENGAEDRKEMESISSISFWMILLVFVLCSAGSIFVILNYRDQFLPLEMDYSKSPFVVGMKKGALKTKQFITNQLDDLNERMKRARNMEAEMRREVEETLREKRENKEWKGGEEEGVMDASIKIKVDQNDLVIEEMRTEANEEQNEKEKNVNEVEIEFEVEMKEKEKENENRNEIEIEVDEDNKEIEIVYEVKEEDESENKTIENEVEVEIEVKVNELVEENQNELGVKASENETDGREVGEMVTECEIKEENEMKNEEKEIKMDMIEVNENDIEPECEVHDESENDNGNETNENENEIVEKGIETDAREVGEMVTECEIKEENEMKNEEKEIKMDMIEVNENDIEPECEVHDESENDNDNDNESESESTSTSGVELESTSSVEENRIEEDFTSVGHEEQTENYDASASSSTTTMNELNEQHPDSALKDSKASLDEKPTIKPEDSSPSSIESFSINATLKEEKNESQEDTIEGQFLFSSILMKHLFEWGKSFSSSILFRLFPCRDPFFNICKSNFRFLPYN